MFPKLVPIALLMLVPITFAANARWRLNAPLKGAASSSLHTAAMVSAPASAPPALAPADDYRLRLDGVTANAYGLEPLAEHDAARTRAVIIGIVGR